MSALIMLDSLKYIGSGLVLVPLFLISKAVLIKTIKELKNDGLVFAAIFVAINIIFLLAPVGFLIAIYFDSGTNALLISSLVCLLTLSGSCIYNRLIKRTFVISIDKETFKMLYHCAKDEGISVKELIASRVRKG